MTHRDEDEEIIDSALDTLAWQRREIDRLKGEVKGLRDTLQRIRDTGDAALEPAWVKRIARAALGEKP